MDKTKCITFDSAAQEALPDHIKSKIKADRDKARAEQIDRYAYCKHSYSIGGLNFDAGYIEAIRKEEPLLPFGNWRRATATEAREFFSTPSFKRPKGRY